MDIRATISFYTRRQQRLDTHFDRLKKAQINLTEDIISLQKRITLGETTGDPVLDYAICHVNESRNTLFSDALNEKHKNLQKNLSKFIPNEICILDFDKFVVQLSDPAYVVTPDRKNIHFNVINSFKIIETKMKGLELKLHSLESCKAEEIGGVEYRSCYYNGWDAINERFLSKNNPDPLLLRSIYEQFGRETDKILYRKAAEAYHDVAKEAVLQIDSLSQSQKQLWDKLEAQRKKLEDLKKRAESAEGRIVLSISDQLEKDAAEINYETEFLRSMGNRDQRREHEWQLRKIEMCLEDAVTLGLDAYEKDVTIEIRPGEYRVFNVSKYIKTLCNYLEIATEKVGANK